MFIKRSIGTITSVIDNEELDEFGKDTQKREIIIVRDKSGKCIDSYPSETITNNTKKLGN